MRVELIDSMGGDASISNSARVSFAKWKDTFDAGEEKLISFLGEHQHLTPFRHNGIQLRCKAPIFLTRQLMKHQAGLTWNEESRRYIDKEPEFFYPEEWRARPEKSIKQGSGEEIIEEFSRWDNQVGQYTVSTASHYESFLTEAKSLYVDMLEANVAPEMARMMLPQSMMVEWIWTGNLLAFAHVYNLRIKANAQQEAQVFAQLLGEQIAPVFPVGWKALTGDKI